LFCSSSFSADRPFLLGNLSHADKPKLLLLPWNLEYVRLSAAALTCSQLMVSDHKQTNNSGETPISRARAGFL
jgi:hypothetical protein